MFCLMLIALAGCNKLPGSCRFSESDIIGKWKLVTLKISYDLGETWKTIPLGKDWIELGPDGEFYMSDPDFDYHKSSRGEWQIHNDSLFYRIPNREYIGGKLCAKIIQCDDTSLILQETDKNGHIGNMYYTH